MTRKRKSMINSRLAIAIAALVVGVGSIWIILVFFGPVVDTGFGSDFWRFAPLPYRILAIAGIFFVVIMTFLIFRLDRSKNIHLS